MSRKKVAQPSGPELPQSLYEKSEKIYPREVHGLFAFMRTTMVFVLLGLFYFMPWVSWGDNPAILFDLPARKFYIFWWTLWPQDFLYLTFLLMLAALALFFFTTLAGRLWCGYACPQTVWTELFMWIERKVEGNRGRQMKLDKAPMSVRKFRLKATKHMLWVILSLFTGFTFVAYFTPADALLTKLLTTTLGPWETFWILFYGFATYGNAGWMREQVCKYMCPYARFQSAMFDNDTLIIAYDDARGEPRGSRRADSDHKAQGLGDCINCSMCVQVCPTGIDIRNGLQYECIGCSACIDVCNDVMDKMGYEKNLIRYTTQHAIDGQPTRIIRPRVVIYAIAIVCLMSLFAFSLLTRSPIGLDVIRDRNQLYREVDGKIENVYTLRLLNMDDLSHNFAVTVSGFPEIKMVIEIDNVLVTSGEVLSVPVRVIAEEHNLSERSSEIEFRIQAQGHDSLITTETARFLGPLR